MKSNKRALFHCLVASGAMVVSACGGSKKSADSPQGNQKQVGNSNAVRKVSSEATTDYASAVSYFQEQAKAGWNPGRCKSAAEKFDDVASSHPKLVEARFNAGVAYDQCNMSGKAEGEYKEALRVNPNHAPSLGNLGQIAFVKGDKAGAKKYWDKAVAADSKSAVAAHVNLAWLIYDDMRSGKVKGKAFENANKTAARHLSTALAVENANVEAYVLFGLLYIEGADRNKSRLALSGLLLDKAGEIDNNFAPLHNARGRLLLEKDQVAQALVAFRRATELDPSLLEARMNVGNIVLDFRKWKDAETEFGAVLAASPKNYDALLGMGVAKRGLKDFGAAEEFFNKAVGVDASRADAYFNLGVLYQDFRANQEQQDLRKAQGAYRKAIGYFGKASASRSASAGLKKEAAANVKVCEANIKSLEEAIKFQSSAPPAPTP